MTTVFPEAEYRARATAAQTQMAEAGLGAIWLTTEADICYFSGFLTRFWASPSRPRFLVLPLEGDPIAVIPEIGAALMARTWINDIRTWPAPRPQDEGVTLLAEALSDATGPIGVPQGPETHVRMPIADYDRLLALSAQPIVSDKGIVAGLRAVKTEAEIIRIVESCAVAERAFDRVSEIAHRGVPLDAVFREFQKLLLEEGADWVGYLAGGAGPDGYEDVISPADDRLLENGDVLMLDTGAVRAGYYCDYDRNYSIGTPSKKVSDAHRRLVAAAEAGLEAALPGQRACDLWQAMTAVTGRQPGRMGHGLGLQLTEGLSVAEADETVLVEGMVVTLEPVIETDKGRLMVHEEVIALTDRGARPLTRFALPALPVL